MKKCSKCGKEIGSQEPYTYLDTRNGTMYWCTNCHKNPPSIEKRIEELEKRVKELENENNKMRYLIDDILSAFDCTSKALLPMKSTYNLFRALNEDIDKRMEEDKEC